MIGQPECVYSDKLIPERSEVNSQSLNRKRYSIWKINMECLCGMPPSLQMEDIREIVSLSLDKNFLQGEEDSFPIIPGS